MKIVSTILANYCAKWGVWEGVRDLMQNCVDGHDRGFRMKVSHVIDTLRIENEGVKLDPRVWLMGYTTKGGEDQRGQYGEGLKLGILALLREGLEVKIINGDESWTPTLEESDQFPGERVLTIYTHARQNNTGKFTIEISPLPKEVWEAMKPHFLFLQKPKRSFETERTDILLGADYVGRMYVKGIFVSTNPELSAGYNFKRGVSVDRDRKMVERWEADRAMANAWDIVATQHPELVDTDLVPMLERGAADLTNFAYGSSSATRQQIVDDFRKKHGENAVAVSSMAEAREAEHHGVKGVVLPGAIRQLLNMEIPTLEKVRESNKNATTKTYSWSDLSEAEQTNWRTVMYQLELSATEMGLGAVEERCQIVDFRDAKLNGTFESGSGNIKIARRIVGNRRELFRVLCHEVAHGVGGDAEKSHEIMEGRLLAFIVDSLLNALSER